MRALLAASWPLLVPALGALLVAVPGGAPAGAGRRPGRPRTGAAPAAGVMHLVRPGQTLWGIAREHGVPLDALARANRLTSRTRLRTGEQLLIPLTVRPPAPGSCRHSRASSSGLRRRYRRSRSRARCPAPALSPFGPRGRAGHGGVDRQAARGADVLAAAPGMAIASGRERAYGYAGKIGHFLRLFTATT